MQAALDRLVDSGLVYRRRSGSQQHYEFKHALVRDAAYETLLKRSRQSLHQRVAELLETRFADLVAVQPELAAYHYTEAGRAEQAIDSWTRAGLLALERWATGEAVSHLRSGLELLAQLPATEERDRKELGILQALGPALQASRGFAAPDMDGIYGRTIELCEVFGDRRRACLTMRGRQLFHYALGEYPRARQHAEELFALAETDPDVGIRIGSHHALGQISFMMGDFGGCATHSRDGC